MKQYIYPKKIIESKNVKDANNLLVKKELQIGVSEKVTTKFSNKSYIILDFGLEMRGGIRNYLKRTGYTVQLKDMS